MESLRNAFYSHGAIIHYSYQFWGGFEMFQFYFPLPYLFAASLAQIVHPNIAFKVTTIVGIVAFPSAFYWTVRWLGLSRITAVLGSLLAISLLHTQAHVMWGGNVFSALAGMIGNCWAFVFFVLSYGKLWSAHQHGNFSFTALLLSVLTVLSHFYGLLMLFFVYLSFAVVDLILLAMKKRKVMSVLPFYTIGMCTILLMAWWIIPLVHYTPYSSDYGGNWKISLLATYSIAEKTAFITASLLAFSALFIFRLQERAMFYVISFVGVCLFFYTLNTFFNSVAFINARLWPSLYLGFYLLLVVSLDFIGRMLPRPLTLLAVGLLWYLIPTQASIDGAKHWYRWNFEGIEAKVGWSDFQQLTEVLKHEPLGRVSFESDHLNNMRLGSVRTFEMLPYLTGQEIIEGGIVNSATYPGLAYALQCLSSNTCAGWPAGLLPPAKDIPRAIDLMRALGITHHIASTAENREAFRASGAVDSIYEGSDFSLFRFKVRSPMVEVFAAPLPRLTVSHPRLPVMALPRLDATRRAGFIFDTDPASDPLGAGPQVSAVNYINYYIQEWYRGNRTADQGRDIRKAERERYLNSYLYAWQREFHLETELKQIPDLYIADRDLDPSVLVPYSTEGHSEVGLPLSRKSPGTGTIELHGHGFRAFTNERELQFERDEEISFPETVVAGASAPFSLLTFVPTPEAQYRYLDIVRKDDQIMPGLPGGTEIPLVERITEQCEVSLERSFHRLDLRTSCPGKPHVIKYTYYPKWRAPVPIEPGPYGFMALTPTREITTFTHVRGETDLLALAITAVTFVILVALVVLKAK